MESEVRMNEDLKENAMYSTVKSSTRTILRKKAGDAVPREGLV
jgi:hypothetical protein